MIAAPEATAAVFDQPQAASLDAVFGAALLELHHPVRDAVHRLVFQVGRQVVEQQHGRAVPGEVMLQREDLAPVAQRTLRQQTDLRQAVEHDAFRVHPFELARRIDRVVSPSSRSDEYSRLCCWSASSRLSGGTTSKIVDAVSSCQP